jgi:hypothetical protein
MRNAAGEEMEVPLKPTIFLDDPQAMRQPQYSAWG